MKTTKLLFPWLSSAPRSEKEAPQPQPQTINPMEQHQTQHRTKRHAQNPKQNQTPNQKTPTMKLRNPLDTMNFFQTLHNWLSGLLRSEKEIMQPQRQTINPMEQHQTQHRTKRKTPNPKLRRRLFSPLTNAITAFIISVALIYVPLLPTYAAALPCEDKDWTSKFSNDCGECPPCPAWRKQFRKNGWYECVKSKSGYEDCIEKRQTIGIMQRCRMKWDFWGGLRCFSH